MNIPPYIEKRASNYLLAFNAFDDLTILTTADGNTTFEPANKLIVKPTESRRRNASDSIERTFKPTTTASRNDPTY